MISNSLKTCCFECLSEPFCPLWPWCLGGLLSNSLWGLFSVHVAILGGSFLLDLNLFAAI